MPAPQDVPFIEACRIAYQMPLAHDGRRISGRLEQLGERYLRTIELAVGVVVKAIHVRVLAVRMVARLGPQWSYRLHTIEAHAFASYSIHIGVRAACADHHKH